jgi:hypothetical protein
MHRPRSVALVASAVIALAGAASCGGGSSDSTPDSPKAELVASVQGLSHGDALTTTVSLDTTARALQAFARAQGSTLSASAAAALSSAHIAVAVKTSDGKDLSGADGTDVSLTGTADGQTLIELRVVNGDAYLRGDVRAVLALAGHSDELSSLRSQAARLPAFVQAFLDGRWVSLSGIAAQGLLGTFGGGTTSSGGKGQAQQLTDELTKVVNRDVTVRKVGTDSLGDHLVLSGRARALAADIMGTLSTSVPGGSLLLSKTDPGKVRDQLVSVDAWVRDGTLTQLQVDLGQFVRNGHGAAHLPLTVSFEQTAGDISKPSGATPVDLTRLSGLAGALSS